MHVDYENMMVKVVGSRAKLVVRSTGGGEHEPGIHDGDSVVGHETFDIVKIITIRTGSEQIVNAEKGDHCGGIVYPHNVKAGTTMYDLGPKPKGMRPLLICKEHYPQLLTLESLFELYSKPYYVVTITDGSDGSVLFASGKSE